VLSHGVGRCRKLCQLGRVTRLCGSIRRAFGKRAELAERVSELGVHDMPLR